MRLLFTGILLSLRADPYSRCQHSTQSEISKVVVTMTLTVDTIVPIAYIVRSIVVVLCYH